MMQRPPHDDTDGSVRPHDHPQIEGDHEVIRRISEHQLVTDANGRKISSSMLYKKSSCNNGGMSVDLKHLIEEANIDPKKYVTTPKWMGSVLFKVSDLRKLDFQVGYDPLNDNPYHGEVWGDFPRSKRRKLAALAEWFVPIDGVNI